jgi:hypothetical protein
MRDVDFHEKKVNSQQNNFVINIDNHHYFLEILQFF